MRFVGQNRPVDWLKRRLIYVTLCHVFGKTGLMPLSTCWSVADFGNHRSPNRYNEALFRAKTSPFIKLSRGDFKPNGNFILDLNFDFYFEGESDRENFVFQRIRTRLAVIWRIPRRSLSCQCSNERSESDLAKMLTSTTRVTCIPLWFAHNA